MERATRLMISSGLPQWDIAIDDINDIGTGE